MKVGVPVVGEVSGAMAVEGAAGGCEFTSGQFTAFTTKAKAFSDGRNIKLLDGDKLKQLLTNRHPTSPVTENIRRATPETHLKVTEPASPLCKSAMINLWPKKVLMPGRRFAVENLFQM